jgi:hypothetical protein
MSEQKKENEGKELPEHERLFVGGEKLGPDKEKKIVDGKEQEIELDGKGEYKIVNPRRLYLGKPYSDWTSDWFNWFLSSDADKRNFGPVVFLRSLGLPNKITGANISDVTGQVAGSDALPDSNNADPDYPKIYPNDPNIRVGSDRLQIFEDQAVIVPIIIAYELASVPYRDWGTLQDYTGLTIDYGDNPPEPSQLTINNKDIKLPRGLTMKDFRIITPVFMAVIPETEYGRSIKDFLEKQFASGSYPAIVEGYFVMLKFEPGSYWVHSWASGPREVRGPYFSELLYQIEVRERAKCDPHGMISRGRPSRNEHVLKRTLHVKRQIGELTPAEVNRFRKFLKPSSMHYP